MYLTQFPRRQIYNRNILLLLARTMHLLFYRFILDLLGYNYDMKIFKIKIEGESEDEATVSLFGKFSE